MGTPISDSRKNSGHKSLRSRALCSCRLRVLTTPICFCLLFILVRFLGEGFVGPYRPISSYNTTLSPLQVAAPVGYHRCLSVTREERLNFNHSLVDLDRNAIVFPILYLNTSNYKRVANAVSSATHFSELPIVLLLYNPGLSERHLVHLLGLVRQGGSTNKIIRKRVNVPFDVELVAREMGLCLGTASCPVLTQFSILNVFGLKFRKVVLLDWRIKVIKNFHHLLACDENLIFTSASAKSIDTDMMVVRANQPNLVLEMAMYYQELLNYTTEASPRSLRFSHRGPKQTGTANSQAHTSADPERANLLLNSVQHFLFNYFIDRPQGANAGFLPRSSNAFRAVEVSRCLYLFQGKDSLCAEEFRIYGLPVFARRGKPLGRVDILERNHSARRCRVDAWIIGARKGGTTAIYTYFAAHPRVLAPRLMGTPQDGELSYQFPPSDSGHAEKYNDRLAAWARRSELKDSEWNSLERSASHKKIFDSAVCRLVADPWPLLRACGHRTNRFIAILRHPVSRCLSQMRMRSRLRRRSGMSLQSNLTSVIERELDEFLNRTKGRTTWMEAAIPEMLYGPTKNCVYEGIYVAHLKRWLHYISREQIFVTFTERMARDGENEFRRMLTFVGLDPERYNFAALAAKYNAAPEEQVTAPTQQLTDPLRKRLTETFAPYNVALEKLLGFPLEW